MRYSRTSRETGIHRGEYARVIAVDAKHNLLTVSRADHSQKTYDPRRQMGVTVYREQARALSVGYRIQFTAPNNDLRIANRELGTAENISCEGALRVRLDHGREVTLDSRKYPHLDHGYAVTSDSSQGQTAERVLIHVDTGLAAGDLLNNRMAYVSVSRGKADAQIFTDSRERQPVALGQEVSHASALEAEHSLASLPHPKPLLEHSTVQHDIGMAIGL